MLLGLYFVIVVALPLGFGTYALYRSLPRTRSCPICATPTLRVRSRFHRLASRLLRRQELHRRWCTRCGWQGTSRLDLHPAFPLHAGPSDAGPEADAPEPGPMPSAPTADVPAPGTPSPGTPEAPRRAAGAAEPDRVDIRRLAVDGGEWRVQCQCWAEGGHWHGRLLFTGPAGRTWLEKDSPIRGASAMEVLSRALSFTDGALAGRLRRATR